MKKNTLKTTILISLGLALTISACKKVTEVTEVNNTYVTESPLVFTYGQENDAPLTFIIKPSSHTYNVNENRLVEIPLGNLKTGDVVIIETHSRLDLTPTDCAGNISIQTGAILGITENVEPNEQQNIIPFDNNASNGGMGYIETANENDSYTSFENTFVATIDSNYENAYASFWVSAYSTACSGNPIKCEGSSMVVSIYKE